MKVGKNIWKKRRIISGWFRNNIFTFSNSNNVNVSENTTTTITRKNITLNERKLEEYLSYVPFYNSEDLSRKDAYSGYKKVISDYKEEMLL